MLEAGDQCGIRPPIGVGDPQEVTCPTGQAIGIWCCVRCMLSCCVRKHLEMVLLTCVECYMTTTNQGVEYGFHYENN